MRIIHSPQPWIRFRGGNRQTLAHVSNTPHDLVESTRSSGILVEAYSPVAHGELLKTDHVAGIARGYGVSVPQLAIRYCLRLGLLPLPRTANPVHMANNADVKDYGSAGIMPIFGGQLTRRSPFVVYRSPRYSPGAACPLGASNSPSDGQAQA